MDGSGYPLGISGEKIFIESRIVAVADTVEAMASNRPYRPARGTAVALEEIRKQRGFGLDAGVVDACLKLFEERDFNFKLDEAEAIIDDHSV
jgi:HD-GYP domain-containing protein (c-di-GMP phosphodiesterase class II)